MSIPLCVGIIAFLMFALERVFWARPWPKVRLWWSRALLLNAVQVASVFTMGVWCDRLFQQHSPLVTHGWPLLVQVGTGYVLITFVYYWWHRLRHESSWLWRWLHQVHHSPQRLEVITSFYKHPLEIALNAALSSALLFLVLGVTAMAGAIVVAITGVAELIYHWNVRTPHWLGYFFQRPEMHCVHHRQGFHRCNFADLPLWDMLFGTYENPREFEGSCGFAAHAELHLGSLLLGRDPEKSA